MSLPPFNAKDYQAKLKKKFGDNTDALVFRRVKYIVRSNITKYIMYSIGDDGKHTRNEYTPTEWRQAKRKYSEQQIDQCLEIHASSFSFKTTTKLIRDTDKSANKSIFCCSENRQSFNLTKMEWEEDKSPVLPRSRDLVAMVVNKFQSKAEKWFVCSDQFLRAWTAINYKIHPSLPFKGREPEKMKKRLMTGNLLMSNSWLKWTYGHHHNDLDIDIEESRKRMWVKRCEAESAEYVHVLCALVLILRYGEVPTPHTPVPNNALPTNGSKGTPMMTKWDLPENFIKNLFNSVSDVKLIDEDVKLIDASPRVELVRQDAIAHIYNWGDRWEQLMPEYGVWNNVVENPIFSSAEWAGEETATDEVSTTSETSSWADMAIEDEANGCWEKEETNAWSTPLVITNAH